MGERIFFEGMFEAMCVQLGKVYQTQMHFFNSKQCLPVEEMLTQVCSCHWLEHYRLEFLE